MTLRPAAVRAVTARIVKRNGKTRAELGDFFRAAMLRHRRVGDGRRSVRAVQESLSELTGENLFPFVFFYEGGESLVSLAFVVSAFVKDGVRGFLECLVICQPGLFGDAADMRFSLLDARAAFPAGKRDQANDDGPNDKNSADANDGKNVDASPELQSGGENNNPADAPEQGGERGNEGGRND